MNPTAFHPESAAITSGDSGNQHRFSLPPSIAIGYIQSRAVVMEGATFGCFVTEVSTMLIVGIVLSVFGIGVFCWLLFILAVYALPFVASLTAGLAAYHSGAGIAGAIVVAVVAGGVTLTIGQIAFATVRSPLIRAVIGLLYAVPAAIAGYNGTLGFAQMGIPSEAWRVAFAVIGAVAVGGTAWARMALFVPPVEGRRVAEGPATHRLTGATRLG
jgi:hypothetical protein